MNEVLGGRFKLESEIGRGGMGVVYRATDTMLNRPVAVKRLPAARSAARVRDSMTVRIQLRILRFFGRGQVTRCIGCFGSPAPIGRGTRRCVGLQGRASWFG